MSTNQNAMHHAKRSEKRRIKTELRAQRDSLSENDLISIPCYGRGKGLESKQMDREIQLGCRFERFLTKSLAAIPQEIQDPNFNKERIPALEKALQLHKNIQKKE